MTDIVERLRDRFVGWRDNFDRDLKNEAADEIERLREALRYEENRSNRIGTHGDGCYSWGPSHYECAMREIERLRKALKEVSGYVARAEWFYMTEETKAVVEQVFGEVK